MEVDINEPFLNHREDENDDNISEEIAKKIRGGFIAKVYGILLYQLFITTLIVALGIACSPFKKALLESGFLFSLSIIIFFSCLLLPISYPNIYQQVPLNYIVMTIFTVGYSWIVAYLTCNFYFFSAMFALFFTFITMISLTIYAKIAEKDFSVLKGSLFTAFSIFIVSCIISFLLNVELVSLLFLLSPLFLISIYILYATESAFGNNRTNFREDDYILAAMFLHFELIVLFFRIIFICYFGKKHRY